jgi:AmmeMemoRadiSam system protein A
MLQLHSKRKPIRGELTMTDNMLKSKGEILLRIARDSIAQALGIRHATNKAIIQNNPWLEEKGACFITLTQHGQLRGCIGTLQPHRSLLDDVQANAKAAAFKDPRFSPLSAEEFSDTQVEVSLLSTTQDMSFSSEQDALAQLQPGIDGVIFEYGSYRSTFLPQVWEQLPDATQFMAHLKQKAGLSADFWDDEVKLSRYTVSKWKQSDFTDEVIQA